MADCKIEYTGIFALFVLLSCRKRRLLLSPVALSRLKKKSSCVKIKIEIRDKEEE